MLPKPRRPREKRTVSLTPATYSIAEFCKKTGLSEARVLRSIDAGTLQVVKVGSRQLILAGQPNMRGISKQDTSGSKIFFQEAASTLLSRRERFVPDGVELGELGKLAHRTNFRAKAAIFTENEPTTALYMVTHGTARLYKMLEEGSGKLICARCQTLMSRRLLKKPDNETGLSEVTYRCPKCDAIATRWLED